MTMTGPSLLMTMSDIAGLARVQRPVVSMWRSRTANSDAPFPRPVAQQRGQDLFDARQVGAWLTETKRGNNPDASADAAAHAALDRAAHTEESTFHPVSALLALRSVIGGPLGSLSRDDLLDAADEHDPDDESFYRELEGIGSSALTVLAGYVDALVEAAYSEPAAFEKLMADRFKLGVRDIGDTALGGPGLQLMAVAALALAATQPGEPVFVDATGSASDVILAIAASENDGTGLTVVATRDANSAARLLRRRLLVHRISRESLAIGADGSFSVSGSVVHVAHLPPANNAAMSAAEMLTAIDNIALQMDDEQLAVILAPSSVLCDRGLSRAADELRSAVLRSGRLRAIVRLPVGLLTHKPQQAQAIWVLGAAHEQVELAARWTLVADLTAVELDAVAIDDLVSDLVASLGARATVRAHAFRFARLVLTRTLLASRDSLVAGARSISAKSGAPGAALAVRAEELIHALNVATDAAPRLLQLAIEPTTGAEQVAPTATAAVEQLIAAGHLRYVPGNRLEPGDVIEGGADADGIRLIGPAEVLGELALGRRRIDRLRFAGAYPAGRVTEPGDVVFCTSPQPRAIVDVDGTSVVVYPARILRINVDNPHGLLSAVLAADINATPVAHRVWRRWSLRQVPSSQRGALAEALAEIRTQQERASERLARLDELISLLMNGATSDGFTVSTKTNTVPTKGTP